MIAPLPSLMIVYNLAANQAVSCDRFIGQQPGPAGSRNS
jgi:hypothetical protein